MGNGIQEIAANNLGTGSLRARKGTCLNPVPTRQDCPLPARPAAPRTILQGLQLPFSGSLPRDEQADFSDKFYAGCLLPGPRAF